MWLIDMQPCSQCHKVCDDRRLYQIVAGFVYKQRMM